MLMLRYWKLHGQPRVLAHACRVCRPTTSIIEARGRDERSHRPGRPFALDRYRRSTASSGDAKRCGSTSVTSLAAGDHRAGGLSFEAVREDLEPALVGSCERATRDRIADLEDDHASHAAD